MSETMKDVNNGFLAGLGANFGMLGGRDILLVLGLTGLGLLGNYVNIELYFGVYFLFGSIATFLALRLYGLLVGTAVGGVVGSYTWILWGHPYAVIIFSLEALVVGYLAINHRKKFSFLIAELTFWLFVGMPLVWLFYTYQLGLPRVPVQMIALKQSVNGLVNVVLASLLFYLLGLYKLPESLRDNISEGVQSIHNVVNNLVSAFILLPLVTMLALSANGHYEKSLIDLQSKVDGLIANKAQRIEATINANLMALSTVLEANGTEYPSDKLFHVVERWLAGAMPGLKAISVINTDGELEFSLPRGALLTSDGFDRTKKTGSASFSISQLYSAQVADTPDYFFILSRLSSGHYLKAQLNAALFHSAMVDVESPERFVELIDGKGQSVAFNAQFPADDFWSNLADNQLSPVTKGMPKMARARKSYWTGQIPLFPGNDWTIKGTVHMAAEINKLQQEYAIDLMLIFAIAGFSLVVAPFFTKKVSEPLTHLANLTSLLSKSTERLDIVWPESEVGEIRLIATQLQKLVEAVNLSKTELKHHRQIATTRYQIASDWTWESDDDNVFSDISSRFCETAQLSDVDILRMPVSNLFASGEDKKRNDQFLPILEKQQIFKNVEFKVELDDGTIQYFQASGAPIYDDDGAFKGYIGVGQNITERKHNEMDRTQMMSAIDNLDTGVALFDFDDRIVFSNKAFRTINQGITGYTVPGTSFDDYLKANVNDALALADDLDIETWMEERMAYHRAPSGTIEIQRQDGKTVQVLEQIIEEIGTILVVSDITASKLSQAQIIQASKLATLGEMATGVAHELNQPLNVIRLAADNLARKEEKGLLDSDTLRSKLDRISTQTERAAKIIDHMRMFGRESRETKQLFRVEKALTGALDMIKEQLRLDDIEIVLDINALSSAEDETAVLSVVGHQIQMEQVLLNLFGNAKDALREIEENKTIRIGLAADTNDNVKITVSDNGVGIPAKYQERIFDPFFTTKKPGQGTGLGLSVSYGIVRDMNGTIEVESVRGATQFTILLPNAKERQIVTEEI